MLKPWSDDMIHYQTKSVTVFQSRMFQLNSTVVQTDDLVLIVDPGYFPDEIEEIRQFVDSIKGNKPIYLFLTHSDYDHIVGFGAFPDAKTIASRAFVESPFREKQLEDTIRYDDEFYIKRPYLLEYPRIDFVIDGGGKVEAGDTRILFYSGIGHNNDGLIAAIEPLNILIAGDYLSDIEFPFIYHSFEEYNQTIRVLEGLQLRLSNLTLIPGHGNVTNDEPEVNKRITDSKEYLEILEKNLDDETFEKYMADKNYHFKTALRRRHRDNIEQLRNEKK
jgi:hydroxyacylglutathione hydrolase